MQLLRRTALALLGVCCLAVSPVEAQVVISEFVASNDLTLDDEDGNSSDWLELHNAGAVAVDVGGYHLTDNAADPDKWTLPSPTVIAPGGFLVVFASDKDRAVSGQELHTNFKLSSGGEYLALVAADGSTILSSFAPAFPQQYTDVGYGFAFTPGLTSTETYLTPPTPGAANGPGGTVIASVDHFPPQPQDTDDIIVSTTVIPAPGVTVTSVSMSWRHNYFPMSTFTMVDDGTGPDAVAGDGVYTSMLPHTYSDPGDMMRWKVAVSDTGGGSITSPLFLDPDNSPEFHGTVVFDAGISSSLPVLHWWVEDTGLAQSTQGTRCSLYYNGEFYDNLFCRARGNTSLGWPKKNFKFDFNPGNHFRFDPNEGRAEEININSSYSDKAFVRRILSWETYRDAGAPHCLSFPVRMERNGGFYSVAVFVEQPDEDYLDRQGLDPNGALYKMFNTLNNANNAEKKTRLWEGDGDLVALSNGVQQSGTQLEHYMFDNIDLPAVANYLAATVLIHDNDHVAKNYYVYRDSDGDGEWMFLPWDKDLTFGRNFTNTGGVLQDNIWAENDPQSHPLFGDQQHPKTDGWWNRFIDGCHRVPRIQDMVMRRVRTLMDELLQPPGTSPGQLYYENRIATLQAIMGPDVLLDEAAWGIPPWGQLNLDFDAAVTQLIDDYLENRRHHLYVTHNVANGGLIPDSQPPLGLALGTIESDPSSGNQNEEYVEIVNCHPFAVDVSGWHLTGPIQFTFPDGCVIPAGDAVYVSPDVNAFRARATGPSGGQGLFVVGPYVGNLPTGAAPQLLNDVGQPASADYGIVYSLSTTGVGDAALMVANAPPNEYIYIPFSLDTSHPVGCGPFLGLGSDALFTVLVSPGVIPFRPPTNGAGEFVFFAPPGSAPPGSTIDSRAFHFDVITATAQYSPVIRVTF